MKQPVLIDFNHLVDLIRNHKKLSKEEIKLWEENLKLIEDSVNKPVESEVKVIIPQIYTPVKEGHILSESNWFTKIIDKLFRRG